MRQTLSLHNSVLRCYSSRLESLLKGSNRISFIVATHVACIFFLCLVVMSAWSFSVTVVVTLEVRLLLLLRVLRGSSNNVVWPLVVLLVADLVHNITELF